MQPLFAFAFHFMNALELVLSMAALLLLVRSRSLRVYWPMLFVAAWHFLPDSALLALRTSRWFSAQTSYSTYFYTYWISYALAALSAVFLTYTIFEEALRPLKGLKQLGSIIYQWTAAVSLALALSVFLSTDARSRNSMVAATIQMERSSAVIVLSLITFVGLAIRPLGLSVRSRIFGLSIGLAFITLFTLLDSGSIFRQHDIFSTAGLLDTSASCAALAIWVYYFYVPEPKRRFILLPTTSPFHTWNQISELLGHDPGYVAIAGVPPESFAPAELDIFGKASKNMAKIEAGEMPPSRPPSYYINMNGERPEDRYRPLGE